MGGFHRPLSMYSQIYLFCFIFYISEATAQDVMTSEVLILGGGMAGVTAAKTLMEHGIHDIVMVEGGDQLGGRVKSAAFGGVNVELGANWVQFSRMDEGFCNPVEEMVKDAQLEYVEDDYHDYIFRENGANVTEEADDIYEDFEEALTASITLSDLKKIFKQPDINFRAGFSINNWRPSTPLENAVEYFDFDFELGDTPSQSSLKNNAKEFAIHGRNDMFVKDQKGYSYIIKNMANKIPLVENKNLFLSYYVDEIKYNETGDYKILVRAYENKNNTKSESNYKMFKAKWVITTFSIGVLQSNEVSFVPALPNWKLDTISKFSMICYTKIFVKFNKNVTRFWDNNHYIFYVNPNVRGHYQTWQNLEAKNKYFPEGTNILMVTIIGSNWEHVATLSKEQIMEEITDVLRNMYGEKAAAPEDILISDWQTNKLFFGAYSNWPIGVTHEDFAKMGAPVGNLYLAGEAYSTFNGFLHGAFLSGQSTAKELYMCMIYNNCGGTPEQANGFDGFCPVGPNRI